MTNVVDMQGRPVESDAPIPMPETDEEMDAVLAALYDPQPEPITVRVVLPDPPPPQKVHPVVSFLVGFIVVMAVFALLGVV